MDRTQTRGRAWWKARASAIIPRREFGERAQAIKEKAIKTQSVHRMPWIIPDAGRVAAVRLCYHKTKRSSCAQAFNWKSLKFLKKLLSNYKTSLSSFVLMPVAEL